MSKYLVSVQEVYRADSEQEAAQLIEEAKQDTKFELAKFSCEKKETKDDVYYKVSMMKSFNDIKDPSGQVSVSYEVE